MMSVHAECIKCGRITHIELAKDVITKKAFEVEFSWICPKCVKKYNKLKIQAKLQEIKFKAKESVKNERK